MALPLSDETQDLLDRAQRAIDHSIQLRKERATQFDVAKRKLFDAELRIYRLSVARKSSIEK